MPLFSSASLRRLIEQGESARVELKARLPSEGALACTLSAFANSDGGTLLIGISDHGEVIGLSPQNAKRRPKAS